MRQYATLTLIGRDKSGVIARVTQELFQTGANIESLEEQVARGIFSMTLQASWVAGKFDEQSVRARLERQAQVLGMEIKLHFSAARRRLRMGILVTKETHVFDALVAAAVRPGFKAQLVLVAGNHRDFAPRAKAAGLPYHRVDFERRAEGEKALLGLCDRYGVDFLVLARFMKILSPNFVWRWKNRIINIHPSLLPAFPGASAYRQAYDKGVKVVGVTAHFVTPDLDQGPIICQEAFRVRPNEPLQSIAERGKAAESKCLLRAVKVFLTHRLDVHWGRVYGV